ncbi:MAG: aspartate carbamoyltransferase [Oscillospiraceae bacterium]|jgi:aspartate carbamoyltransferase catalytic subunit|nr:aspartate carbamoyltransferase [Oscillospiraceae bacterium]
MLYRRHILNIEDLSVQDLGFILSVADRIAENPESYGEICKGKILATLFFEPSTRTRLSFESAMLRMGGRVLGFSEASTSSTAKGETPEDTARMIAGYADVVAVRHPTALVPHRMSAVSEVPLINGGDGSNEHPTQTLTDLVTIHRRFGSLENLTIGLCGDLKHGRTVHSLIKAMKLYPGTRFVLIAPDALEMPKEFLDSLDVAGIPYRLTDNLEASMPELDILYMTRIQRERFQNPTEYRKLKGVYVLDADKMAMAKKEMIVMHPLPRVDEIATDVDADPRAFYFEQAKCGVLARMALIIGVLGLENRMGEGLSVHTSANGRELAI